LAWTLAPAREGAALWHMTFVSPLTSLASASEAPRLSDRRLLLFARSEAEVLALDEGYFSGN
jgi:hypothetical protein